MSTRALVEKVKSLGETKIWGKDSESVFSWQSHARGCLEFVLVRARPAPLKFLNKLSPLQTLIHY